MTVPIDIKNPNVAPEEIMYCASVAIAPRGPGPALMHKPNVFNVPQNLESATNETNSCTHKRAHNGTHTDYTCK